MRFPPWSYFVGSAVFHYLGPSFAVLLFPHIGPLGVAGIRIWSAAAVFALWRRPWRTFTRRTWRTVLVWGAVLAAMNSSFYMAIARLPLATVAAIEFLPVIVLAALGIRTRRNLVALVAAVGGVYVLTEVRIEGEPLGFVFAFANAALFALYIVVAHKAAQPDPAVPRGAAPHADEAAQSGAAARSNAAGARPGVAAQIDSAACSDASAQPEAGGIDGLAMAMVAASVFVLPIGGVQAVPALADPVALAAGVGVGISSSVIPYVCDQLAMARLSRATYALMVSLLPATAAVTGLVVLRQVPAPAEIAGVGLVIAGVAVHRGER